MKKLRLMQVLCFLVAATGFLTGSASGDAVTWDGVQGGNIYYNSGNVGIGTTAPGAKLEVTGRIFQSGLGGSTFVGYGAGANDDLTDNNNTAIGNAAFYLNTEGNYNNAIGLASLYSNTSGIGNVANGVCALQTNETGSQNVAVGFCGLQNNTAGYANVAIGNSAFQMLTSGSLNVAIGNEAGKFQADGATQLSAAVNSIYIGNNAKGYNDSDTNSIVIGSDAIGLGANTVVLGNDNITTTALKGNVGIGTTTPGQYKLAVEGKIGAREIVVTDAAWADHVFHESYYLRSLDSLGKYIQANKHLPDIPSEREIKEKGLSMADMMARQMQKIEELTLYLIEKDKEIETLEKRLAKLES